MQKSPTSRDIAMAIIGMMILAILWLVQSAPKIAEDRLLKSPTGNLVHMAVVSVLFIAILWAVQSFIRQERTNTIGEAETGISKTLFILAGIPLIISPCLLLANLMSMAGHWTGNENILLFICVSLFMGVSSVYPFTYLLCWSYYKATSQKNIVIPLVPIIHLVVAILLGILWGVVEALVTAPVKSYSDVFH
ncbi:MAG: hypothetical protein ACYDCO_05825 [Armatimonadota bacterium]